MMFTEIDNALNNIESSVNKLSNMKDFVEAEILRLDSDIVSLNYNVELHQKCVEIFKRWLEDALKKNLDSMTDLATTGLRHIIPDQKLTFRVVQEMKYNRLAMRFILEEETSDGMVISGDPIGSYGGGAAVVISLILRMVVITKMNMARLLLLDESMVALANVYVPSCAQFMRELSEKTGINILMVTHNTEFLSHAHIAYEGFKDGDALQLRKISGGS